MRFRKEWWYVFALVVFILFVMFFYSSSFINLSPPIYTPYDPIPIGTQGSFFWRANGPGGVVTISLYLSSSSVSGSLVCPGFKKWEANYLVNGFFITFVNDQGDSVYSSVYTGLFDDTETCILAGTLLTDSDLCPSAPGYTGGEQCQGSCEPFHDGKCTFECISIANSNKKKLALHVEKTVTCTQSSKIE